MLRSRRLGLILVALMIFVTAVGCNTARRPQQRPPIPGDISQGEGREPRLKVYIADSKQIREMPLEEYLTGVVAGEMKTDWPEEALAAQAILARTYVMEFVASKKKSKYPGADISTDITEAQAWNAAAVNDRVRNAIKKTRGQVLTYNNNYIRAWFHAHAGGKTATPEEGLNFKEGKVPYIQVVESPDSPEAPKEDANWTATFTKQEIIQAAREQQKDPGNFTSIEIVERGPSGRATKLKIGNAVVDAPAFRVALDSMRMKSTLLKDISVQGDQVTMSGAGYGHGVGMSQWGAYQMAKEGRNAEQILNHYFKNVNIVKMWD